MAIMSVFQLSSQPTTKMDPIEIKMRSIDIWRSTAVTTIAMAATSGFSHYVAGGFGKQNEGRFVSLIDV